MLLGSRATVNVPGCTALHYAAEEDHLEIMKLLLVQTEPSVLNRCAGRYSKTPLLHAAELGNLEAVKILISAGSVVSAQDGFGETPLHYAAENGHLDVVKALVQAGSSLDMVDSTGRTPIACAQQKNRVRVVQ